MHCRLPDILHLQYMYYNQLHWLGVNFGLTGEYGELI